MERRSNEIDPGEGIMKACKSVMEIRRLNQTVEIHRRERRYSDFYTAFGQGRHHELGAFHPVFLPLVT
jgi:hypothetical protein